MTAIALERSAWLPQAPRGMGLGALLALLVHGGLVAALALGLNWRNRADTAVMSAELWSALPQVAAPAPEPVPAPPPPAQAAPPAKVETRPPPPAEPARSDAQIAIEKAERAKKLEAQAQRDAAERARLEAERLKLQKAKEAREDKAREDKARADKAREDKRQKELAEQREAKAADERIAQQRADNLRRMLGQAGAAGNPGATGSAAQDAAPSAAYAGRIKARIKPNIVLTAEVAGNPVTEVEVRCAPDGAIVGRRIVKSSGNTAWDDTVLRAIDRTEGLPRDVDGRIPATLILVFPRRE